MPVKIGFISLGCDKNRVDSEIMLGLLQRAGYVITSDMSKAEIIIINTCGFIDPAKEESIAAILEAAEYKKNGKCRHVLVAGCLAQRYGAELLQELPEVDGVMGTGALPEIVSVINRMNAGERPMAVREPGYIYRGRVPRVQTTLRHTAYLKIAEGCDNRCSYCIIPSVRGRYRSRPLEDLLAEAQELCSRGVRELVLVAQETTRYGVDIYNKYALADLLQALAAVEGLRWIRLMYTHPASFTEELIAVLASFDKICRYIDLPLQHASDRILHLMNRRGRKKDITRLIGKLRSAIPGLTLRTTFLVGFPGETERDFIELLSFMEQVQFERVGIFGFSPEEGTPAAAMPGRVDDEVVAERMDRAMRLQQGISLARNRRLVGSEMTVLVEGWDDEEKMYWGRTEADAPEVDGRIFFVSEKETGAGEFVRVKVLDATEYDLAGVRVG